MKDTYKQFKKLSSLEKEFLRINAHPLLSSKEKRLKLEGIEKLE